MGTSPTATLQNERFNLLQLVTRSLCRVTLLVMGSQLKWWQKWHKTACSVDLAIILNARSQRLLQRLRYHSSINEKKWEENIDNSEQLEENRDRKHGATGGGGGGGGGNQTERMILLQHDPGLPFVTEVSTWLLLGRWQKQSEIHNKQWPSLLHWQATKGKIRNRFSVALLVATTGWLSVLEWTISSRCMTV